MEQCFTSSGGGHGDFFHLSKADTQIYVQNNRFTSFSECTIGVQRREKGYI